MNVDEAIWQIWYEDTFDRETLRQIETSGQGLTAGLVELWSRHLQETVQAGGEKGFSRFNLWWKQERKSVEVVGEWSGQVRLREWIYGGAGDKKLLQRVAAAHTILIRNGKTSETILAAAETTANRQDFAALLRHLE